MGRWPFFVFGAVSLIIETGRVVAIEASALWVETLQKSTCDSCSAKSGCGQSLLDSLSAKKSLIRVLPGDHSGHSFQLHEQVEIGIPERVIASGSLATYFIPLLMMVGAVLGASSMGLGEGATILSGLFGLFMGGGFVRYVFRKHQENPSHQPVVVGASGRIAHSW